jgi:hypothetical protein
MKFNLYEQFLPQERALLLLNKYPLQYVKDIVNGIIYQSNKNHEIEINQYWNEVAIEIKKIIK